MEVTTYTTYTRYPLPSFSRPLASERPKRSLFSPAEELGYEYPPFKCQFIFEYASHLERLFLIRYRTTRVEWPKDNRVTHGPVGEANGGGSHAKGRITIFGGGRRNRCVHSADIGTTRVKAFRPNGPRKLPPRIKLVRNEAARF